MRVLIVDDEKLARDRLRELLNDVGGYSVVGEAMSGSEAIEKTIGEKAFMMEKQRERDLERMELKPDIKGIGSKIESDIEKIEKKKKDDYSE